jgi:hypothetical protein
MFLGLELKTWLALSVLGAIVSTLGSLLGVVLKEYFFSRSFESWKQRQTLEQLYKKFRDPLFLSARELASRITEILDHFPPIYLNTNVLATTPVKQVENNIQDPYFQRYKLISTAYRLSAFLAWVELYRQELTFLHPSNSIHASKLETAMGLIRSDLADGQLNRAKDWEKWRDRLIFREELRAIGESLIEARGSTRTVIGYGRYCELFESTDNNTVKRWLPVALNFLLDFEVSGMDFRKTRMKRLVVHLVDLMLLIDHNSIESFLEETCVRLRGELN